MPDKQLAARIADFEKLAGALAAKIDRALEEIAAIKSTVSAISATLQEARKSLQNMEQFDALMRSAKATQEKLAQEISSILSLQQSQSEKIMKRFDDYEAGSIKVRETQQKLAREIAIIAASVKPG